MPVLVLNTCVDANMQSTICSYIILGNFSLTGIFPDIFQIFSKIPDISLTDVKFPEFPDK